MAIDESWDHRQATAVETGRSFWNADVIARADCDNLRAAHEECHGVAYYSCSIDKAYVMNGNGHDLPSYAIGMSGCLQSGAGGRHPSTSNADFFKGVQEGQHIRLRRGFSHEPDSPHLSL